MTHYTSKTKAELIVLCKENGITGYSGKKKAECIKLLTESQPHSESNIFISSETIKTVHIHPKETNNITEVPTQTLSLCHDSAIDESMVIKSKKYKTFGDLKRAGIKALIHTTARMDKCIERDLIDRWLWCTYYSKKEMFGNLTMRLYNINNTICYREIMRRCFNNTDILSNNIVTKDILPPVCIDLITQLHSISPSMLGTFIDYLMRRIISELTGKPFEDSRSRARYKEKHICNKPIIDYGSLNVLELREQCKKIGAEEGYIIQGIGKMDRGTMLDLLLEQQMHIGHCKLSIECLNKCVLPICQHLCYKKAKDTLNYKTKDIIVEMLITSLFHSEAFGHAPQQEHFNKMLEGLTTDNNVPNIMIASLTSLCYNLIKDKDNILLNPALGGKLDGIDKTIPADADLVIDDILYDIKCTKGRTPIRDITQLLGYSSLFMLDEDDMKK